MGNRTNKLVTLLMTNYNHERFIEDAVNSIANQTYQSIEIIIIDDGSTDNSKKKIEGLKIMHRSRFLNFRTIYEGNGGINAALNRGIPLVQGDITIILDADDMLHPEYVFRTTESLFLREPKNLGFVYSDCGLMNEKGENIGRGLSHKFDAELLKTKSYIPGCGATLTGALVNACPLDERIKVATKVYRWRDIVAQGYIGLHIAEPLFFYRMHKNNISGIGEKVMADLNAPGEPNTHILSGYWQGREKGL